MRRTFIAVSIVLVLAQQALAWSDAGHKIIASIAFSRLTAGEREAIVTILREHPRFKSDFIDEIPASVSDTEKNEWFFQQVAVWPDMARGFKGSDREKFHHSTWHYINVPSYLNDGDETALEGKLKINVSLDPPDEVEETMNAIQTIRIARRILADGDASKSDRAVMLAWLFHVVGDIHQPLHSTALFSQKLFPEGDRGGNLILTKQHGNLHAVWDQFLGDKATLKEAHQDARNLLTDPALVTAGERGVDSLDEEVRLNESHKMAGEFAYGPLLPILREMEQADGKVLPITLREDYLVTGGGLSKLRVVMAGYRLASVLQQIVEF
jgi:hypothetical protein